MAGSGDQERSKAHHYTPQFFLRGFTDADNRLTVVALRPKPHVRRRQHPRNVGFVNHLNSVELADGSLDDGLERGPMNRLDDVGADARSDLVAFASAVDPPGQLRLWDHPWEERVTLCLMVAGLLVRSPAMRDELDRQALPSLIAHMRRGIEQALADGTTDPEVARALQTAFDTPGMVQLDPASNRHQAAFMGLLQTVAASIGSRHLVSVRRVETPLLTGSQPVIAFPTSDLKHGRSFSQLLVEAEPPVRMWDLPEDREQRVTEILDTTAGMLWAADRHTVVLFSTPDFEEGGKLTYMVSELPDGALADVLNLQVTIASDWIAGVEGDRLLEIMAAAITQS